jgi:hypothetical protein
MWEPRHLTTLWACTACYGDSFMFFYLTPWSSPTWEADSCQSSEWSQWISLFRHPKVHDRFTRYPLAPLVIIRTFSLLKNAFSCLSFTISETWFLRNYKFWRMWKEAVVFEFNVECRRILRACELREFEIVRYKNINEFPTLCAKFEIMRIPKKNSARITYGFQKLSWIMWGL